MPNGVAPYCNSAPTSLYSSLLPFVTLCFKYTVLPHVCHKWPVLPTLPEWLRIAHYLNYLWHIFLTNHIIAFHNLCDWHELSSIWSQIFQRQSHLGEYNYHFYICLMLNAKWIYTYLEMQKLVNHIHVHMSDCSFYVDFPSMLAGRQIMHWYKGWKKTCERYRERRKLGERVEKVETNSSHLWCKYTIIVMHKIKMYFYVSAPMFANGVCLSTLWLLDLFYSYWPPSCWPWLSTGRCILPGMPCWIVNLLPSITLKT